ncbi:DUF4173 domain-containing protein [Bacteroidales bacterium OttesenSCG-928-K03]|nr:DUF4173 domain-containing protein [Odoribacter sp. OttesenSCG-928-L07]MDL2238785.1 DUF4173 domain-containing protein [Bacteroidales bacterium OttesenSCG-928-L14]MDL2242164.1 DUF4173 domain-containing protein [Bacteroidales bacterium OttesenSCG-928-K03]
MKKYQFFLLSLATALIFTFLFYKKSLGINLLLFEAIFIPAMIYMNRPVKFNFLTSSLLIAAIVTGIFVMLYSTTWGIIINFLFLFMLATALNNRGSKSFIHVGLETFPRTILAQTYVFQKSDDEQKNSKSGSLRKIVYFVIIPLLILIIFFLLYVASSSTFYNRVESVFRFISELNFALILFFILGIIVANVLLVNTKPTSIYTSDTSSTDDLIRRRKPYYYHFRKDGLIMQNRVGIILLVLLNLLILFFNYLDISTIWFGFTWEGDTLKEFVHQGTWVLILTVIISAGIALYFFHNNLNFYSKNKTLKTLTVIWLCQNFIMMISVIIRNYWYIHYFGLAYKRIAVMFFLVLVAIGLISIIFKVLKVKSTYYLLRVNGLSLFLILFISTLFNWDVIIAKHNFKHYDRSYVEYRFMAKMDESALPYTVKPIDELINIDNTQREIMPAHLRYNYYWSYSEYYEKIEEKKDDFLLDYPNRKFLEWNYADYKAYKMLTE